MSVNPNQSWITPQTSLFGIGNSSNTFNQVFANQVISATNNTYETRYDLSGTGILNKVLNDKFIITYDLTTDTRMEVIPTNGVSIGFYGTTEGGVILQDNNTTPGFGIAQTLMSSMTGTSLGGGGVLDLNGLISTLKVVYPPIVK